MPPVLVAQVGNIGSVVTSHSLESGIFVASSLWCLKKKVLVF